MLLVWWCVQSMVSGADDQPHHEELVRSVANILQHAQIPCESAAGQEAVFQAMRTWKANKRFARATRRSCQMVIERFGDEAEDQAVAAAPAPASGAGALQPRASPAASQSRDDSAESCEDKVTTAVLGYLSALTPVTFDSIVAELVPLLLAHRSAADKPLKVTVFLIFEQAIAEARWPHMYADVCVMIARSTPPPQRDLDAIRQAGGTATQMAQRRLWLSPFCCNLLDKVEAEFSASLTGAQASAGLTKHERRADPAAQGRRFIATVRFAGQLAVKGLMSDRLLHETLTALVARLNTAYVRDDVLEATCILLTAVGPIIERPQSRLNANDYFQRIEELSRSHVLSSRKSSLVRRSLDTEKEQVDCTDEHGWRCGLVVGIPRRDLSIRSPTADPPDWITAVHRAARRCPIRGHTDLARRAHPLAGGRAMLRHGGSTGAAGSAASQFRDGAGRHVSCRSVPVVCDSRAHAAECCPSFMHSLQRDAPR